MTAGFDAFLSYSRRASSGLAVDLQGAVERFAKPWYSLRAVRIFRDDASMSANVALWSTIEQALSQAEWFVLLASPGAAESAYVAKEVEWWRTHKSADRVLIVLEEGADIFWDDAANDFDWERTESLPRALSGAFAEEPRWIDLRWFEADDSLGRTDPRWTERVADVAAAVRFAERDQLIGENVREHRKLRLLRRAAITALVVLLVLSLVAAFLAIGQSREAGRQRDAATEQARIALARQLAAQAVSLGPTDLQSASLLAVQAFRTHDDVQTRAALFQLATASPQLLRPLPMDSEVSAAAATPDGLAVTGDVDGNVLLWAGAGAAPEQVAVVDGTVRDVAVTDDGSIVAIAAADGVTVWRAGVAVTLTDVVDPVFVDLDARGERVTATDLDSTVLWSIAGAEPKLLGSLDRGALDLALTGQGLSILGSSGSWSYASLAPFRVVADGTYVTTMTSRVALSADGGTATASNALVDYPVWRGQAAYADDAMANAVAHTDFVGGQGLALSADGRLLAAQTSGRLQIARVQTPQDPSLRPLELGGTGQVSNHNAAALSFGGHRFLVSAAGQAAYLWDLDQFSRFGRQSVPDALPERCTACELKIAVSPDGQRVVSSASGAPPVVTDVASGSSVVVDEALEGLSWRGDTDLIGYAPVRGTLVAVDPDSGAVSDLARYPVADGALVLATRGDDEQAVGLGSDGVLTRLDLESGQVVETSGVLGAGIAETEDVIAAGIAPDLTSAFVAVSGYDDVGTTQHLDLLDLATDAVTFTGVTAISAAYDGRSRLHVFDGETAGIVDGGRLRDVVPAAVESFPPPVVDHTGDLVASGGLGGLLTVLDLARQGAQFGTFEVPQTDGRFVLSAFSGDGASLVTVLESMPEAGYPGGAVRTVSLVAEDWIAAACAAAGRDLTAQDWDRYGVGTPPEDLRCLR